MKKYILALLLGLAVSSHAFALSCNMSQSAGQPDECWTLVTVSSAETTLVSRGTVLVLDTSATTPRQGVTRVKVSSASGDTAIGVAQGTIVSGASTSVMVRGYGFIKTNGGVTVAQNLSTAASGGSGVAAVSGSSAIATSLATTSGGSQETQAFIRVV